MKLACAAAGFALIFAAASACAASHFTIDPASSYVDAWVPTWLSEPVSTDPIGSGDPPSLSNWILNWDTQRFALGGTVTLTLEPSPFVPGVSHVHFSSDAISTDAPSHVEFALPDYVTLVGTALQRSGSPGWSDPFTGIYIICGCVSTGGWNEYEGLFDGVSLQLAGGVVGAFPPPSLFYSNLAESPQLTADQLEWAAELYTFNVTAHVAAVPEPRIAAMLLIGLGMVGLQINRTRRRPPAFAVGKRVS